MACDVNQSGVTGNPDVTRLGKASDNPEVDRSIITRGVYRGQCERICY
jgi:hypothetical protein